jgi:membrane protein implicated in regulation of membrane protease activity
MVEFLDANVLWWHWLIVGFVLLILEMSTGTFVILGLGIAAVVVGVLDFVMPMSFINQMLTWIALSLLSLWAWKKWAKTPDISSSGQSDHTLDTLGTVTQTIHPNQRGKVTFDTPVLGNSSWHATATQEIAKNSRIKIVEINGQLITVEKV